MLALVEFLNTNTVNFLLFYVNSRIEEFRDFADFIKPFLQFFIFRQHHLIYIF